MRPKANGKESPASSEAEKEADLEAGNRRSSSSSKTEVETQVAAVNPSVVDWDGPDDPQNPMNWSSGLKWGNVAVISSVTFLTYVDFHSFFKVRADSILLKATGIFHVRPRCARSYD